VTVRFAIVGYGMIADAHATAIQASEDAQLVSVADPDQQARQTAADRWGCSTYATVDQMLGAAKVDAACVCAPPAFHRPLAERLLEAGVHVLCEKPLAVTVQDARAMAGLADEECLVLACSSKFRFVPDLIEARRHIEDGIVGQPIFCEVTLCARSPVVQRWSLQPELSGGGVVIDNGPHAYDIVAFVLGRTPIVTAAVFGPRTLSPEVEDTAEILFRTDGGAIGRIALSWTYVTKDLDYLVVQGSKGTLRVGWTGGCIRVHGESNWTPFGSGYRKGDAFRTQLATFLSTVGAACRTKAPAEAIRALDFVERVYEVERLGRAGISVESWETLTGVAPR
jgi:predicted dehydrogenase